MKKKHLYVLFISIFTLTLLLMILGFLFNKSEAEKQNGLSDQYDVSSQGTIAYVSYSNGRPQLFLYNEKEAIQDLAAEYDENTLILDPSFSGNGAQLAFITTNKNKEESLTSTVFLLDLVTKEITSLFTDEATITEIELNPAGDSLFYFRAGTFENYSPIVGKRPHDFDIYQYSFDDEKHEALSALSQYSMDSLQVSPDGKRLYYQTLDDEDVETAEDSFLVKQRIFELSLEDRERRIISDINREDDIFSFRVTPQGHHIIFQSISNPSDGGTFEYELFSYNLSSKEESQLTHFGDYVGNPMISADGSTIYFMRDPNFASGDPKYSLYYIPVNGGKAKEILLPTE